MVDRRTLLLSLSSAAVGSAWAQSPAKSVDRVADKLRIVIPANAGGGWDATGRMLGASLMATGAVGEVDYENKGGKGGTVGLPYFIDKYSNDPNALFIAGAVMVGAVALHKPSASMSSLAPLSKLTSEYIAILANATSKYNNAAALVADWKATPSGVRLVGGPAGGIEHMFAGILMRSAGTDAKRMNYTPFASGKNDVDGVLGAGNADVAVIGLADARESASTGKYRILGVSHTKPLYGLPMFKNVGLSSSISNWRGVFTGKNVAETRREELLQTVLAASRHPSFTSAVKQQNLEHTLVSGSSFASAIDNDVSVAQAMVYLLGLKA
jgi:putative tricarboxylic transport membrane protein